jgi:hypothetical protein
MGGNCCTEEQEKYNLDQKDEKKDQKEMKSVVGWKKRYAT